MALQPNILFQGAGVTPIDRASANLKSGLGFLGDLQSMQNQQQLAPLQNQLFQQKVTAGQRSLDTTNKNQLRTEAAFGLNAIKPFVDAGDMQGAMSMIDRLEVMPDIKQRLIDGLNDNPENVRASLNAELSALQRLGIGGAASQPKLQFGAQQTFKDKAGNLFFGTQRRNPLTGEVSTQMSGIGGTATQPVGGLQVVGSFGETGQENLQRKLQEAQEKADIDASTKIKNLRGEKKEERIETIIDTGIAAKDVVSTFDRMLELINVVDTGGLNPAIQRARQLFGAEVTDLAELDALFKESVLGSIKQLGSNPTEGERKFIVEAQGSISQNPKVLKRLIERRKKKAENAVKKAIDFATDRGDQDALFLLGIGGENAGQTQQAEESQETQGQQEEQGVLMEDAQGNRAIVFPDGTFREVQ